MSSQQVVRAMLINHINEDGVKLKFIAAKIGINYSYLLHFKNGTKRVGMGTVNKIGEYVSKRTGQITL